MTARRTTCYTAVLTVLAALGCGDSDQVPEQDKSAESTETPVGSLQAGLRALSSDLEVGSKGEDVVTVHRYLRLYGYFPDAALQAENPDWQPRLHEGPAELDTYDEHTADAIRLVQVAAGLEATGAVDEPTRKALRAPRCGTLDQGHESEHDKFSMVGGRWNTSVVTWRMVNTNDVTLPQARAAAAAAFATWAAQTTRTFTEITTGTADIMIRFDNVLEDNGTVSGPGGMLGRTTPPAQGGDMTIDIADTWSVAATPPPGSLDLQTLILHELGHALGLHHSDNADAVMSPFVEVFLRTLHIDDRVGVSNNYDTNTQLPGGIHAFRDISIGKTGQVWAINDTAVGNNAQVVRWNGTAWQVSDGVGTRIAVDGQGRPWVTQADGTIFVRSANSATSGYWQVIVGQARDIAVGADESVWCIGWDAAPGGFATYKLNAFLSWDKAAGDGGTRIAVGPTGRPWIITSTGSVRRRTTNSATAGSYAPLGTINAGDIAVSPEGYGYATNKATLISGGWQIAIWNEQTASAGVPGHQAWLNTNSPNGADAISAGPNAALWFTDGQQAAWRVTR